MTPRICDLGFGDGIVLRISSPTKLGVSYPANVLFNGSALVWSLDGNAHFAEDLRIDYPMVKSLLPHTVVYLPPVHF